MRGLILCAGLGERLRPVTANIAKPAVPFLNVPMLAYPLFWLEQLKLKNLAVNTHYRPETVEGAARAAAGWNYDLRFFHESPEILGSGGAIWNARDALFGDNDFVTANGDAVFFLDRRRALTDMLEFHRSSKALATLLVCPFPGVGDALPGVWINGQNQVLRFGKGPNKDLNCLHFTGIILFSETIFSKLPSGPSNILYDVLQPEIAKGERVFAWVETMKWYETGRPRDFLAASRECLDMLFSSEGARWHVVDVLDRFTPGWRNHSEEKLFAAEKPGFEHSFTGNARVLMAKGVHSSTSIQFEGHSVLGAGLDLSGRGSTEGVYVAAGNIWVR